MNLTFHQVLYNFNYSSTYLGIKSDTKACINLIFDSFSYEYFVNMPNLDKLYFTAKVPYLFLKLYLDS